MVSDNCLVIGEYGIGADGPTIILVLTSRYAASWLKGVLLGMVGSDGSLDLLSEPGVRLKGVGKLELVRCAEDGRGRLGRTRRTADFVWSCSDEDWQAAAELLQSFVEGATGHQYLTSSAWDDAVIEVSYGEQAGRTAWRNDSLAGGKDRVFAG
jgi:hypothetical protein